MRAIVTTMKEMSTKNAFTDGDVQSAKYVTNTMVDVAGLDNCEDF